MACVLRVGRRATLSIFVGSVGKKASPNVM